MPETLSKLRSEVNESVASIKNQVNIDCQVGIILGTGLSGVLEEMEVQAEIAYEQIPNFPQSTVDSHSGKMIFGEVNNKNVIAMRGRFHYYEGYSMQRLAFPIRVLYELGIKDLIITNACGSLHPSIPKGSIMLIEDHINLLGDNPLIGEHDDYFGPRFVDMSEPYNRKYIQIMEDIALENKVKLYKGIYAAMCGPSLETRAEYRFLRQIGADAIGMSTIPENIVARQMGINVLGISILTDECYPDSLAPVTVDEIIEIAKNTGPTLTKLISDFISKL